VAFCKSKKKKLWVWRAVERNSNRTLGWRVGNRSTATFRKFYRKFEHLDAVFYTDNWESYAKVIPAERHIVGKKYTVGIEQNNSNIRHFLGRFTRRTKVVSKSAIMVLATLKICWYINENNGFDYFQNIFLSIYG
jgi:insertion element IS1 protein InsB